MPSAECTIGVIGGGQLALMLGEAAQMRGLKLAVQAAKAQDPDSMRNLSFEDFKPFVMWLSWGVYPFSIAFFLFFGLIFSLVIGIVIKN